MSNRNYRRDFQIRLKGEEGVTGIKETVRRERSSSNNSLLSEVRRNKSRQIHTPIRITPSGMFDEGDFWDTLLEI